MIAAQLVAAMRAADPSLQFFGLGGPAMAARGVHLYADITQMAVIGFIEVLKHYTKFRHYFKLILEKIRQNQPSAVILIDYPGFNLRLAKKIKELNIPVIYYISPKVWAWKEKRVSLIKKYVDTMMVIFPFEKDFYARHGMNVHFVGNPLVDLVDVTQSKANLLAAHHLSDYKFTIGLLPGSREKEIERLLPAMLKATRHLKKQFSQMQFLLPKAPSINKNLLDKHINNFLTSLPPKLADSLTITITDTHQYNTIHACDLCIVASGTATLETALLQKPMVVIYKTNLITWGLAKFFVKIKNIALVNIVANRRIVPELLQFQATGKNIANAAQHILTDDTYRDQIIADLLEVKRSLGTKSASICAAQCILKSLTSLPSKKP